MSPPTPRRLRCWPALAPRTVDLYGMDRDGRLCLWQTAATVQPLDHLPTFAGVVVAGHYVMDLSGKAITVHIVPGDTAGTVAMEVMCSGAAAVQVPRLAIERDTLGQVLPDPPGMRWIGDLLRRITAEAVAQRAAYHRRGWE